MEETASLDSAAEGDSSQDSQSGTEPKTPKLRTPQVRGVAVFLSQSAGMGGEVGADALYTYEWPREGGGERWFLQEQITDFLHIKSFKRKYPDVHRRPIGDPHERDFLRESGVVSETQMELGLTALRSADVVDLMRTDYPEHHGAYQLVLAARAKLEMEERHRELTSIAGDTKRLGELRAKAQANAAAWNAEANAGRRSERRGYWDIQTNQIQYPQKRAKVEDVAPGDPQTAAVPSARPQFGEYPVPLIHGQFGNYYKEYTGEELRRLPLRTALEAQDYAPIRRPASPPAIVVTEAEIRAMELAAARVEKLARNPDIASAGVRGRATGDSRSNDPLSGKECAFCSEDICSGDRFVECASCRSVGHPSCLEMSEAMLRVVGGYPWMCMECKPCSCCSKLDQEDRMMFCDLCDRGYHTFCVGLSALPQGVWVCQMFCKGQSLPKDGVPTGGRRSAEGGDEPKCRDCGIRIHKGNKVHHRSKFRDAGYCNVCVQGRT